MERGGSPPAEVYRNFAAYAGSLPVVAFNFEYDWNDVLLPERQRLGIPQIGVPGFCALKLAQRLLDPVSAGNCKLQTLRQYYRLPENGAQTALADVLTVIAVMQQVLRPLAERRGLDTWEKVVGFTGDEWFSSRLSFGKFKRRRTGGFPAFGAGALPSTHRSRPQPPRGSGAGLRDREVEDSIRSKLFAALRPFYQERDRLRLLIQYRKGGTRDLACGFQRPR